MNKLYDYKAELVVSNEIANSHEDAAKYHLAVMVVKAMFVKNDLEDIFSFEKEPIPDGVKITCRLDISPLMVEYPYLNYPHAYQRTKKALETAQNVDKTTGVIK